MHPAITAALIGLAGLAFVELSRRLSELHADLSQRISKAGEDIANLRAELRELRVCRWRAEPDQTPPHPLVSESEKPTEDPSQSPRAQARAALATRRMRPAHE